MAGAAGAGAETPDGMFRARDRVVWNAYDSYVREGVSHPCLMVGYEHGFQVWDLHDLDHVEEVVSVHSESPARIVRMVPPQAAGSRFSDREPVVAFVTGHNINVARNSEELQFYSIRSGEIVTKWSFRSPILNILMVENRLAVVLCDGVSLYDLGSLSLTGPIIPCLAVPPRSVYSGTAAALAPYPVALGTRWMAYASPLPPPTPLVSEAGMDPYEAAVAAAEAVASHAASQSALQSVAANVVSGFYSGVIGFASLGAAYISGGDGPAAGDAGTLVPNAAALDATYGSSGCSFGSGAVAVGAVQVRDIVTDKVVSHFVVEGGHAPVTALAFDPVGVLLAVALHGSLRFYVYRINPQAPPHAAHQLLYICERGVTEANVSSIEFSSDSRWLAVTTRGSGTTHVYAVHPGGGRTDVYSHLAPDGDPFMLASLSQIRVDFPTVIAQPVQRVHTAQLVLPAYFSPSSSVVVAPFDAYVARFLYSVPARRESNSNQAAPNHLAHLRILVTLRWGGLALYSLSPQLKPEDPTTLELSVKPAFWWDLCRLLTWGSLPSRVFSAAVAAADVGARRGAADGEQRWVRYVERYTHTERFRPLWGGPQFAFQINGSGIPHDTSVHREPSSGLGGPVASLGTSDYAIASYSTHSDGLSASVAPVLSQAAVELLRTALRTSMASIRDDAAGDRSGADDEERMDMNQSIPLQPAAGADEL